MSGMAAEQIASTLDDNALMSSDIAGGQLVHVHDFVSPLS